MECSKYLIEDFKRLLRSVGDINIDNQKRYVELFSSLQNPFSVDELFYTQTLSFFSKYGLAKGDFIVGPDVKAIQPDTELAGKNLPETVVNGIKEQYNYQFVENRRLKLIGLDLDDCIYDNAPVKDGLLRKLAEVLCCKYPGMVVEDVYNVCKNTSTDETYKHGNIKKILLKEKKTDGTDVHEVVKKVLKRYGEFMSFKGYDVPGLYKPYDGVIDCLISFMNSPSLHVVGIITNGESSAQRKKLNVLGLDKGAHYDFVLVSDDIKISKPSGVIYNEALKLASASRKINEVETGGEKVLKSGQCMILEDRVRNISGAEGWLKVQFLRGRHSNKLPASPTEIPKYGISNFSTLSLIPDIELDMEYKELFACCFLFKSLLLMSVNTLKNDN